MSKKLKILEFITEIIGWIQIFISPFAIGIIIALIVYYLKQDNIGIVIASVFCVAGFIFGIVLATRSWKNGGTNNFLSRTMASPELDCKKDSINEKK
jgi:hypothetical protein